MSHGLSRTCVAPVSRWSRCGMARNAVVDLSRPSAWTTVLGFAPRWTHLTSIGHRHIAFVGTDALGDMQERLSAYREYCALTNLAPTKSYVRLVANKISSGERALAALWALSPRPTAIVAANDTLAFGLIHAAFECNVAVPDDLSIVGFDDIPLAAAAVPGLTTLRMPTAEIVAAGVELAIGRAELSSDLQDLAPTVFQPKLIVRRSTTVAPKV